MLGSVSSSAWADSYTIDFKTFFNTATADNPFDTKTLNYSVAKLTISDLAGGLYLVRITDGSQREKTIKLIKQ